MQSWIIRVKSSAKQIENILPELPARAVQLDCHWPDTAHEPDMHLQQISQSIINIFK